METTKIAFPPPPPTINSLTSHQRTQLVRTTKKLSQVLGATPHYLDQGHILVDLPFDSKFNSLPRLNERQRRRSASIDTVSSSSTAASFNFSRSSSPIGTKTLVDTVNGMDSWREHHPTRRPPLLRLALTAPARPPPSNTAAVKPNLDTIPASPALPPPSYTLSCTRSMPSTPTSPTPPSFTIIPSESTLRKSKMDRLRRKLGDNVPVDLVFPSSAIASSKAEPRAAAGDEERAVIQIRVARSGRHQDLGAIVESLDECCSFISSVDPTCSVVSLPADGPRRRVGWPKRLFGGKRSEA